jgi:hypothetical protein
LASSTDATATVGLPASVSRRSPAEGGLAPARPRAAARHLTKRHTAAFRRCGRPDLPMSGRLVGWTREPSRAKQTPTNASLPSLSVVSWPGTDVCQAGDEFATAGMHRDETLEWIAWIAWIAWIRDFLGFLIVRQCNAFGVPHGTERDHITSREEGLSCHNCG